MQGSPNAERLMKTVKKYFQINNDNYNRVYCICMDMKVVYVNEKEENKVLFKKLLDSGVESTIKLKGN